MPSVKGLDVELTARPLDGLTLHAALTYVKSGVGTYLGTGAARNQIDFTSNRSAGSAANMHYNWDAYSDLGEDPDTLLPSYVIA
jgi:hypothetical protein